jgi:hypothetical protein
MLVGEYHYILTEYHQEVAQFFSCKAVFGRATLMEWIRPAPQSENRSPGERDQVLL